MGRGLLKLAVLLQAAASRPAGSAAALLAGLVGRRSPPGGRSSAVAIEKRLLSVPLFVAGAGVAASVPGCGVRQGHGVKQQAQAVGSSGTWSRGHCGARRHCLLLVLLRLLNPMLVALRLGHGISVRPMTGVPAVYRLACRG